MSANKLKSLDNKFFEVFGEKLTVCVTGASTPDLPKDNTAMFMLNNLDAVKLRSNRNVLLFVTNDFNEDALDPSIQIIKSVNPRLSFIKFLKFCTDWDKQRIKNTNNTNQIFIDNSAYVDPSAKLSPFVYVGPNCYVGPGCLLEPGVKLIENVRLESNVIIGANSVIGQQGFSIERKNNRERTPIPFDGKALSMPHLGGVEIADDCTIGSNCTVASGTIYPTVIMPNVKTDDQVHIGHNCEIGEGTAIAAQAEISGSVIVEKNCWIGPNCSITQKVKIGERSLIGIGSNILRSVNECTIQAGNPAKKIKENK